MASRTTLSEARIPKIADLAAMYRKAMEIADPRLINAAESALKSVAVAESAIAEAQIMSDFLSQSSAGRPE